MTRIKRRFLFLIYIWALLGPVVCLADGQFYAHERATLELPTQRAVILFNGSEEILMLQSKFTGAAGDFGWVIPLPRVPELASMEAKAAQDIFERLAFSSRPELNRLYTHIGIICLAIMILVGFGLSLAKKGWAPGCLSLMVVAFFFIAIPQFGSYQEGVRVLAEKEVGVFDVKVIQGDDSAAIIKWLKDHSYHFDAKDKGVFDKYVAQGWCFVTARIAAGDRGKDAFSPYGMVNPLLFRFNARTPVYPLALTGTSGKPTEVVLYVFSPSKMAADDRFTLRFAKPADHLLSITNDVTSTAYGMQKGVPAEWATCNYLTKFQADLTADLMDKDLTLKKAGDNAPFREKKKIGQQQGLFFFISAAVLALFYLAHLVGLKAKRKKKTA